MLGSNMLNNALRCQSHAQNKKTFRRPSELSGTGWLLVMGAGSDTNCVLLILPILRGPVDSRLQRVLDV